MKLHDIIMKKIALAASALVLGGITTFAHADIKGLELLDRIGREKVELKTYYAATPTATELSARTKIGSQMGRAAGVTFTLDKPLRLTEHRTALISDSEASATFEVDSRTGNFLFNGGLLKYRKDISTPNLPQDSDLPALASKTLERFNLKVDPAETFIAHIGGLNMAIADGSGKSEIFEKLKTIRLGRTLDGLKVEGDARIVVQLGEQAELASMVYQWPRLEKSVRLTNDMLQKPDVIRTSAKREIEAMAKKALSATLTRAELVLFDDGQGVVEPAYYFVLERQMDMGDVEPVMIPYDFYVPATLKPVALFPHMEVAPVKPADGRDTLAVRGANDS